MLFVFGCLSTLSLYRFLQLNNLRLSHLERNKEIMDIKRQLLLQEVNNLLLQADIAQRERELSLYKESRRHGRVRRWNTFSGADVSPRQVRQRVTSLKRRRRHGYGGHDASGGASRRLGVCGDDATPR